MSNIGNVFKGDSSSKKDKNSLGKSAAESTNVRRGSVLSSSSRSNTAAAAVNTDNLPDNHDLKNINAKRKPADNCMLCDALFTTKMRLLNRNPIRHCKKCGKSICEVCSDQKRQLSSQATEKYRICDLCDFEMDNEQLMKNLKHVETTSLEKIEVLNSHILQLNENKEQLMDN